ncbi:MAG: FMN-binding protein [Dethiobacter sp.]|jgi:electron transport complex protein RnfG|nr:FMN-binding protein [Dethiobacter sp.]
MTSEVYAKQPTNWVREGIRGTLVLAIICAISASAITMTRQHTAPIIAHNEYVALMNALDRLMPEADTYEQVDVNGHDVYLGVKNNNVFAAAVPGNRKGFWGQPLEVLVLVTSDGSLRDVIIRNHGETPGIGTKVESQVFLSQFKDKTLIAGKRAFSLDDVDIVSGATVSSRAVANGILDAIDLFLALNLK